MIKIFFIAIVLILAFYTYSRYLEASALFHPSRNMEASPRDLGIAYQEVNFFAKDGIALRGWFVPAPNASVTVLLLHGNGGNISHRLEKISFFHRLGMNLFLIDYRGFGQSSGRPSESGLYLDAMAAREKVKEFSSGPVIVYGESLGAAVAIELGLREKINGLILEGAFTSIPDMARIIYPLLPRIFLRTKFDSLSKISQVRVPLLVMHSLDDDVIPFAMGEALFAKAQEPKIFVELSGPHNECFSLSEDKISVEIGEFSELIRDSR